MNTSNIFDSNSTFTTDNSWLDKLSQTQNCDIIEILRQINDSIGGDHIIHAMNVVDYEKIGSEFERLNTDQKFNMYLCDRTDALCIHDMDGYPYMEEEFDLIENLYFERVGTVDSMNCYEVYLLDSLGTYSKFELVVE